MENVFSEPVATHTPLLWPPPVNGSNSFYLRMRDEDVPRVNALLVANKVHVRELTPQRATLEEVFLTLTGPGVTPSSLD